MSTRDELIERMEDAIDCAGAAREDHEIVAVTAGDIRQMLDALQAHGWQGIGTLESEGEFQFIGWQTGIFTGAEIWNSHVYRSAIAGASTYRHLSEAAKDVTHWMPLPPPPGEPG